MTNQDFNQSYSNAPLPAELEAFRRDVRAFCREKLPAETRTKVLNGGHVEKSEYIAWQKILAQKGWFTGFWPKEHGGLGWSPLQCWIFDNEVYYHGSPWLLPFGYRYVAPVLYTFGSEEQRQRFLPDIRNSDVFWAQGYSETGAGSDLAAVTTRAVRDGGDWVVSGTKVWTTMAHWADMMFAIVRTEEAARPQQGLSFLLIDLHAPGVTVNPIRTIDGDHHVNEVVMDEVRVPGGNLVGEPGRGWTYAKFLLDNERLLGADLGGLSRRLDQLRVLAGRRLQRGVPLAHSEAWRARIGSLQAQLMSLESLAMRMLSASETGAPPGAEASMLKLVGSRLGQAIAEAMMAAVGHAGLSFETEAFDPGWNGAAAAPDAAGVASNYLYGRAATIYGGSSEIQKNIIAKTVLGL